MNDSQSVTTSQPASAQPGRTRGPDPAKRARFLEIARRRFVEDGYAKTSVSAIVREAGVAQGTFYLYFKSKEQLLGHLRMGVLKRYIAAFEDAAAGDGPADARLVQGLEAILAVATEERDLVRMFRQAATGEQSAVQVRDGRRRLAEPVSALLSEGVAEGCFDTDDPVISAHLVISLLADLQTDTFIEQAQGPVDLIRPATRLLLRGLGVPRSRVDELVPTEGSA